MRVLVFGERGQLAQALRRECEARGDLVHLAGSRSANIVEFKSVRSVIDAFQPELIINAAAYTAVDRAEEDKPAAYAVNRDGARHVAVAAASFAVPLIHVSTDYVFDGLKTSPYTEEDKPNPLSVYGASKLAGELAVAENSPQHLILRTSWVCGPDGSNFVKTILKLTNERNEIKVVRDQIGAPTFTADLAHGIMQIADQTVRSSQSISSSGIYHLSNSGETSRFDFAVAIAEQARRRNGQSCIVRAISSEEYPTPAERPKNSRLDCSKVQRAFHVKLPPWQTSLEVCMDRLLFTSGPRGR